MSRQLIRYRLPIILASVVLALGFSSLLFRMEVDPDLKHYFPENMTSMVQTDRIEEVFGNQDLLMVILKNDDILEAVTLQRIKALERAFRKLDGVSRTSSIFGSNHIYSENGIMYVEPTVEHIPKSRDQREILRSSIRDNKLVYKVLVSEDFEASALVLNLEKGCDENLLMAHIRQLLKDIPGEEEVYFGGLPYLRVAIDEDIKRDGLVLIPIALVLMFVFLIWVFREWRVALLPFAVVLLSSLLALAMIPLMGWKFTLITLLAPILLIAVANDYGIHMVARSQEMRRKQNSVDMKELSADLTRNLWKPILLTGLTTLAGISALWAHSMIPARQMALVAGVGILLAVLFSLFLLPALHSYMKVRPAPVSAEIRTDSPFGKLAVMVEKRSRWIPRLALGLGLLAILGIFLLRVDSNEENFFPEKHEVKQSSRLINACFGGSENISLLFEGDMMDPELLQRMETYCTELKAHPAIDQCMAFSSIVREISKALNDEGDPWYDRIPPTREAVAQYMELYHMNGDPAELEQMVDFNYRHGHLMIRINDASNRTVNDILGKVDELAAGDPSITAVGGNGYIRAELANMVLSGTLWALGIALVVIFGMLSVIFRSAVAGMLGMVPLLLSVAILFGSMGWLGIRLDVATALLASIMMGVGVDYTIHFLWRYREERQGGQEPVPALSTTLGGTGRGIVFNALSVIVGFLVLLISSFSPIRFFGLLVVLSISSCLAGALILLPALVLRYRFAFLEGPQEGKKHGLSKKKASTLHGFRRVAMGLALLLMGMPAGKAQNPRDIIERSQEVVKISSFEALSTLTITDARGRERIRKSSMASMSFPDGSEKRIIKFLSPAEVKGTGILIHDYPEKRDDMWIYLPALRKTRRIVSKEKSKSFMGSEFSNANMTAPGLDDFSYRLAGEEVVEGAPCYLIESLPLNEDLAEEYGYARSLSWVDKNTYLVYRSNFYSVDGDLIKTIRHLAFEELGEGRYMVSSMEARNLENHRKSTMVLDQVALTPTRESYFTVAYLEKQ